MPEKTIAAISTPKGRGGIAVIRISGEKALEIADKCFLSFSEKKLADQKGYTALYGKVTDADNEEIDEAVALVFRAPHSFTGENTVELSVHGGMLSAEETLKRTLECGAVLAMPGEFSKRAFLNGKMDLAQAESIAALINAETKQALRQSISVKTGGISKEIEKITDKLLETAACFAAYSDFPDEDIEQLRPENFISLLNDTKSELLKLLNGFENGRIIREGIDCAIVGKPNVGKSTLMNMLSRTERSIVTNIAGTTRDIVEDRINLNGIVLNLADTAGIRETDDEVEKVGVIKAKQKKETAALVLAVFDSSTVLDSDDISLLSSLDPENTVIVLNKSDLGNKIESKDFEGFSCVLISAQENEGADELKKAIEKILNINESDLSGAALITVRQKDCAKRALSAVNEAIAAFNGGVTLDAVAVIIDDAVSALLELTGKRVTNEVADEVFKRFCIGK